MEEAKKIEIITPEGILESVNLITYLISDDGVRQYVVYSKNETIGDGDDRIIYISKVSAVSCLAWRDAAGTYCR